MATLISGLVIFFATHVYTGVRDRNGGLSARIGELPFKGLYSVVSLVGLGLIIHGYSQSRGIDLWSPPAGLRHLTLVLMLPAMILLVATYTPLGRIKKAVKHPMFAAIKIWAFAHLLANGDLASVLLFGSFLAWAVFGRIAAKRRKVAGPSGAPSVAGDAIAVVVGAGLYAALVFYLHAAVIGVAVTG